MAAALPTSRSVVKNEMVSRLVQRMARYRGESESNSCSKGQSEQYLTPKGGYRKEDLARMGVNWPLKKGWKERHLRGEDPNK